jgi:putative nucleotidyltransferase with HDIG domain
MAKSFFGRLNTLFSETPSPAAPVVAAPVVKRAVVRFVPRPEAGEKVDQPEMALRQIVRMQLLGAISPPKPAAAMRTQILANLQELHQIPALESLAQGFSRVMSRPDVSVEEIVASVSKDPALSVRILRMANSVDVSSEQRIDRLDVAVQMLGVTRVRKAADALFFLNNGSTTSAGLDWRHLWVHSLGTAAIAERLEKRVRGQDGSTVYVAGLLHDVGKIVLSTLAPEEYKAILVASWKENSRLEELERAQLGVDHAEAGVSFAHQNHMADSLVQVISHHAAPQVASTHRFEVAIVSLANHLAKAYGFGFSGSMLQDSGQEFEDLPAWKMIAEETGAQPAFAELEEDMQVFTKKLRNELGALRES